MARKKYRPEHPWDRQLGETRKAWEAFTTYRTSGPTRSVPAVSKALRKTEPLLYRWSRRWDWRERVAAWDAHCAELDAEERAAELKDSHQRHQQLAKEGLAKILLRLQELDPDDIPVPSISGLARTLVDIELNSFGEPTMEQHYDGDDAGKPRLILEVDWGNAVEGADQASDDAGSIEVDSEFE